MRLTDVDGGLVCDDFRGESVELRSINVDLFDEGELGEAFLDGLDGRVDGRLGCLGLQLLVLLVRVGFRVGAGVGAGRAVSLGER